MSTAVRSFLVVIMLGSGLTASASGQATERQGEAIAIADPEWLKALLERERKAHRMPAIAAAVVVDGKVLAASAVGVRKFGSPVPVSRNDAFHLGSLAKPLSATMFGVLVDQGVIRWNSTMAEMFPELADAMQPAYRPVTVAQLLSHTGGFPDQPETSEKVIDARARSTVDRRYEYVKAAVEDLPAAQPGTKVVYSGGGIIVASAVERRTKQKYETLMQRLLFKPLGMTHAGFGCMATEGRVNGPWGHVMEGEEVKPIPPDRSQALQPRPRWAGTCTARSSTWPDSPLCMSREDADRAGSSAPRPSGGSRPPNPAATSPQAGRSSTPTGPGGPSWPITGRSARIMPSVAWHPPRDSPSA